MKTTMYQKLKATTQQNCLFSTKHALSYYYKCNNRLLNNRQLRSQKFHFCHWAWTRTLYVHIHERQKCAKI